MTEQLELFAESRRLVDAPLEQRLAGAAAILEAGDTSPDERWELLALVAWPALAGEEAER